MTERTISRYDFEVLEHRGWCAPLRGIPAPGDLEHVEFDTREEDGR